MKTKTHRISDTNMSAPEGVVIIMNFPVLGRHEVLLAEAATYIRTTQGMVGRMPTSVTLTDGRQVFAAPCIIARTPMAAEAMSHMLGYTIEPGDGVSCCTQLQARERYESLTVRYGVPQKNLRRCWMITPPKDLCIPKTQFTDEQRAQALADAPPF
jgi:hypothetical protein